MTEKPTIVRRPIVIPASGLMTPSQTAEYLGMSRSKFYEMLKAGKGPPESDEVPNRFLIDAVEKWLGKAA